MCAFCIYMIVFKCFNVCFVAWIEFYIFSELLFVFVALLGKCSIIFVVLHFISC